MSRNSCILRRMDATPQDLQVSIGRELATLRHAAGLSARALAEACQGVGLRVDRNRMADLELGRKRPVSVQEMLGLAYVLRGWPADLLVGTAPVKEHGARYQAWASSRLAITEAIAVERGAVMGWLDGTWPAWGDEPDAEFDPTLRDEPELSRDDLMSAIKALAATHGMRVTFEPMQGELGEQLRGRAKKAACGER